MAGRVLIVGQGVAGTALGLEFENAGADFAIASAGHAEAASAVAAGLINPVTGQRAVKSAQIERLLPQAEAFYRRAEDLLGVALWHPLQLTRQWSSDAERERLHAKIARGDLAPFATSAAGTHHDGVRIVGAARVDLRTLLEAAAARWQREGRLRPAVGARSEFDIGESGVRWRGEVFAAVVLCTGASVLVEEFLPRVPFVTAKGEIVTVVGSGVPAGAALNRAGSWLIGGENDRARVGATFDRGVADRECTAAARAVLLEAARAMTRRTELAVVDQVAGVRSTLPDRMPVAGWVDDERRIGIAGALGSKGALWAPELARQWRAVLCGGGAFSGDVDVARWEC